MAGVRADRGVRTGHNMRRPGAAVRLTKDGVTGSGMTWLTLEQAQVLLGDLTRVVREIEAERIKEREAARAGQ